MLFIIFILGLTAGSFLNCVIYRLDKKESFLSGRSFCPSCKKELNVLDLIPVLSYLSLKGKCRYCKERISLQYPLVEMGTAFLFVFAFYSSSPFLGLFNALTFLFLILISSFFIIIFVYDLKHFLILDKVLYPAVFITFLYRLLDYKSLLFNYLPVAVLATLFFLFIFLVSRGKWMGFGDVKLAFLLGFFLGFPNVLAGFFFSFLIGAVVGVGLIIAKKSKLKSEVPFAPFLVIGSLIGFYFGEAFFDWYLSLIF